MKAKEFVTEIYKIQKGEFTPDKSHMNKYDQIPGLKTKSLPGGSGLHYSVNKDGDTLGIYIVDFSSGAGDIIGQLDLSRYHQFPIKNAWQVDSIVVDPEYRGRGIGQSLYGVILSILKYPLVSGFDQTSGGQKSWLNLASIPGVEIKGYVPINDNYFDVDPERPDYEEKKFKRFLNNIMNMGGEYLGKSATSHYFAFDVESGTGKLEPVVKNQLKLYNTDFINPGLFAIWTG